MKIFLVCTQVAGLENACIDFPSTFLWKPKYDRTSAFVHFKGLWKHAELCYCPPSHFHSQLTSLCPVLRVVNCWPLTAVHTSLLDHINEPYLCLKTYSVFPLVLPCDNWKLTRVRSSRKQHKSRLRTLFPYLAFSGHFSVLMVVGGTELKCKTCRLSPIIDSPAVTVPCHNSKRLI